MNKKQPNSINQIQRQGEATIFLNHVLQWVCSLQSKGIEIFEEERVAELGQLMAKKLGIVVFCDLDRNYRSAHNLRILIAPETVEFTVLHMKNLSIYLKFAIKLLIS